MKIGKSGKFIIVIFSGTDGVIFTGHSAAAAKAANEDYRKEEPDDTLTENENRKVGVEVGFRPPHRRNLRVAAVHDFGVKKEPVEESENPDGDECDEEFFPVHRS